MRWEHLSIEHDEAATLPGYREPAHVRRFDVPEAMDTRFYEVRAKSVLNRVPARSRMPFRWTINPYRGCSHACAYCFARPTHTFLGFDPGRDFEREIVVKVNAPEVVRAELGRPRWGREHVAMGTNTDPYQWVESKYRLMPEIWEALGDSATPSSVLTKSPLLLRDADLMVRAAERAPVFADLSIPTWDERAWRQTEPHTPHPRARMEAVAELNRRGIPTGVLVAPLMPGINDAPAQLEPLLAAAAEAGAVQIGGIGLHLRGETRDVFMDWLRSCRPDLVEHYEELYGAGDYLPSYERQRLARLIRTESRDPAPGVDAAEGTTRFRAMRAARRGGGPPSPAPPRAGRAVAQETLF
ncbi:MAG: radical SAM protein [Solirubrobacteraceae bacterium]|nr:radical SAM protein [Solirubrobacteraceae bacterium]